MRLAPTDRIDFLLGGVGIEVKVDGSTAQILRQLRRYASSPQIEHLVLVTNRARHRSLPAVIGGKPLRVVHINASL